MSIASPGKSSQNARTSGNFSIGHVSCLPKAGGVVKMRLDQLLIERGYFADAHDARAAIMAGEVVVGEHRADSAGMRVASDVPVRLKTGRNRGGFVSRGGLKLQRALEDFHLDVAGLDCVDLGASSGGFTDCLLQRGAAHVSAVDVGAGQFDWGLRNDVRISLFEHTNIRGLDATAIGGPFDCAVADLSFVSLCVVMPDVVGFLKPGGIFVSLIKPQFEAGKREVEAGGVVRDAVVHVRCIANVAECAQEHGLDVRGLSYSPITGPAGNIEFLFWAKYPSTVDVRRGSIDESEIARVVDLAHAELGGSK
jgi:23S rRNA (cytidine1920-2'-O)/16S rRNA (cytidine1409-2'-O)-methyltransferase